MSAQLSASDLGKRGYFSFGINLRSVMVPSKTLLRSPISSARPESIGKHVRVEAVVRSCCQFQQPFAAVPAAGQDRIDIEESRANCLNLAVAAYLVLYDRVVKRHADGMADLPIFAEETGWWHSHEADLEATEERRRQRRRSLRSGPGGKPTFGLPPIRSCLSARMTRRRVR